MIQLCPYCKEQWCDTNNSNEIKEFVSNEIKEFVKENPVATLLGTTAIAKTLMPTSVAVPVAIAGMKLLFGKKYQFYCSNCGGEWETDDEEADQTKEFKKFLNENNKLRKHAMESPISDKALENYKALKYLVKYKELAKKNDIALTAELYEERFEELSDSYINNFLDIPERDRRFLVVVDDLDYLPDSFMVLPMNKVPREMAFPTGHPRSQELYVVHPYKPNEYIPYNKYQMSLFRDEIHEFVWIMDCLGAKTISFSEDRMNEQQIEEQTDKETGGGASYAGYAAKGSYGRGESSKEYKKLAEELKETKQCNIVRDRLPYIPEDVVWYHHRPEWQRSYKSRTAGRLSKASFRLSTNEISATNNQERKKIEADLKILAFKANGNHKQEESISLCSEECHTWAVDVEFYPLSAYNTNSNKKMPQSTQSAALTANEDEYLIELKEILSDGEISPKERRLLEKIRIQSGISKERAAELENSLTALKLTEEEQEYLDEYKDVIADGEITEKALRLLDKFRKLNGISEERAREIEASVRR